MCIMTVMYRTVPNYPIVIAANRDEDYRRSALGPRVLQHCPTIWGGRDQQANGSWLGVNAYGLMVGLTNRKMSEEQPHHDDRRSRGLLCLDALRLRRPEEVIVCLTGEPEDRYNPFNLLVMDAEAALWVAYDGKPDFTWLEPGLHILGNRDLNEEESLRAQRARGLIEPYQNGPLEALMPHLQCLCRDHQDDVAERDALCMHRDETQYGTVSSSILALAPALPQSRYLYADGHPCMVAYQDYSFLFRPEAP